MHILPLHRPYSSLPGPRFCDSLTIQFWFGFHPTPLRVADWTTSHTFAGILDLPTAGPRHTPHHVLRRLRLSLWTAFWFRDVCSSSHALPLRRCHVWTPQPDVFTPVCTFLHVHLDISCADSRRLISFTAPFLLYMSRLPVCFSGRLPHFTHRTRCTCVLRFHLTALVAARLVWFWLRTCSAATHCWFATETPFCLVTDHILCCYG